MMLKCCILICLFKSIFISSDALKLIQMKSFIQIFKLLTKMSCNYISYRARQSGFKSHLCLLCKNGLTFSSSKWRYRCTKTYRKAVSMKSCWEMPQAAVCMLSYKLWLHTTFIKSHGRTMSYSLKFWSPVESELFQ